MIARLLCSILFSTIFALTMHEDAVPFSGDAPRMFIHEPASPTGGEEILPSHAERDLAYEPWQPGFLDWKRTYNNRSSAEDTAVDMVPGPEGSVLVTGMVQNFSTGYDIATIIYDSTGNLLHQRSYSGAALGNDVPVELVADLQGSAFYLLGETWGSSTAEDYLLLKYDGEGNWLWTRTYDGPSHGTDTPCAMALDSSYGIGVTGTSLNGTPGGMDYCTVKYDADGTRKWVAYYNGPGNWNDCAVSIAIDSQGSFVVTGYAFQGFTREFDITTCKYDSSGSLQWVRTYNGPASEGDYGVKVRTDSEDNVAVCGYSRSGTSHRDYVVLKYSPAGEFQWERRYNGPAYLEDYPRDMLVDEDDNIFVTGMSRGTGGDYDFATVKYSPAGERLWEGRFDSLQGDDEQAVAMTRDASGNIYVTGTGHDSWEGHTDVLTIKYDASGELQWIRSHDGSHPGNDLPAAIFCREEDLYIAGSTYGGAENDMDYLTIKYVP